MDKKYLESKNVEIGTKVMMRHSYNPITKKVGSFWGKGEVVKITSRTVQVRLTSHGFDSISVYYLVSSRGVYRDNCDRYLFVSEI